MHFSKSLLLALNVAGACVAEEWIPRRRRVFLRALIASVSNAERGWPLVRLPSTFQFVSDLLLDLLHVLLRLSHHFSLLSVLAEASDLWDLAGVGA